MEVSVVSDEATEWESVPRTAVVFAEEKVEEEEEEVEVEVEEEEEVCPFWLPFPFRPEMAHGELFAFWELELPMPDDGDDDENDVNVGAFLMTADW